MPFIGERPFRSHIKNIFENTQIPLKVVIRVNVQLVLKEMVKHVSMLMSVKRGRMIVVLTLTVQILMAVIRAIVHLVIWIRFSAV